MDKQQCRVCGTCFDFDVSGLASMRHDGPFHVCSPDCGRKAAGKASNYIAIHDETDAIVETDAPNGHPGLAGYEVAPPPGEEEKEKR